MSLFFMRFCAIIGKTFGSFFSKQEIDINAKTTHFIFKNIGRIK